MLPELLIEGLRSVKGFDEAAFREVHASGGQVTSIRINPQKKVLGEWQAVQQKNVPWCADGKYLPQRPSFTLDPLFHGGAYYVQEASSMFLWQVIEQTVGNKVGLKVLDLCAAPGGKTTLLASYFKDGLLVSNEVIKSRASVLVENITKWGSENVIVTNNDPKDFATLEGYFDVIVVDAPCSGSGLFRKDPDAIREWSEDNVVLCSQRQQRILADVYPALKKDGVLIYATCSYSFGEDEYILDWFSQQFAVASCRLRLDKDWNIVESLTVQKNYGYRFYPDKLDGEGFFIAAFQKHDGDALVLHDKFSIPAVTKKEGAVVNSWLKASDDFFLYKQANNMVALPEKWKYDFAFLQKRLYLRKAGVTIGAIKGEDLVPDHELALSLLLRSEIPSADVSKEQALQYLRRKDIQLNDAPKGWLIIKYCGINLGWVKVLHNRINNYYPVNRRILKD